MRSVLRFLRDQSEDVGEQGLHVDEVEAGGAGRSVKRREADGGELRGIRTVDAEYSAELFGF